MMRCIVCEQTKPDNTFPFVKPGRYHTSGRKKTCRVCAKRIQSRKSKPRLKRAPIPETQVCEVCGTEKPAKDFPLKPKSSRGLQSTCRRCKERRKARDDRNREHRCQCHASARGHSFGGDSEACTHRDCSQTWTAQQLAPTQCANPRKEAA